MAANKNPFNIDLERLWKDEDYRKTLHDNEVGSVASNPAGAVEVSDADLDQVTGANTGCSFTAGCCDLATCWGFTQCGALCTQAILSNCC